MSFEKRIDSLIGQIDTMSVANKVYNWGIISCGKISSDFANCLDKHPRAKIVACAARRLESAKTFGLKYDIDTCYDDYGKLACDKSVDIVYIGTIHPTHCENVLTCLNNKKHVICEKPIGMNANEAKEMIECAKKNNCFLLEAVWTRFFPATKRIRSLIESEKAIGDAVSFIGDFGVNMPSSEEVPRLWDVNLGGGGTLDLGCYVVAPLSLVFGSKYPQKIAAIGTVVNGIDTMMSAVIQYNDTQFGSINCNMYCNTPEEHIIVGTKGSITIHSPAHAPTSFTLTRFGNSDENRSDLSQRDVMSKTTEEFSLPKGFRHEFVFPNSQGFYYEISEVIECIDKGLLESPNFTHQETLITNQIMDEIRKQIGVKYKQDVSVVSNDEHKE